MNCLIESADYKIFTAIEGSGRPVVLLHSLWGSHRLFENITSLLSKNYKVIRIDFPGHGNSPSPQRNFTFDEFAGVLNDLLGQLNIQEDITLIGHSMGGFAALAFSRLYRKKVSSLILVHTLVRGADRKSIRHRLRQAELIRQNKTKLLLQFANESNFAAGNASRFSGSHSFIHQVASQVTEQGALAAIYAINTRQNSLPFLMNANIPLLFVIGKQDRIYNPDDQLWEQRNIPGADVLILQNSGHLGFFEEEDLFNENMNTFLSKVSYLKDVKLPV